MSKILTSILIILVLVFGFGNMTIDYSSRQEGTQKKITPMQTAEPLAIPLPSLIPTLTPIPGVYTNSPSVIDFAYSRESQGRTIYYAFDEDTKTVLYFDDHEPYAEKGTFTGNPSNGIEMFFAVPGEEWIETLTMISPYIACIDLGNGYQFDFYMCSPSEAESILMALNLDIESLLELMCE